nr:ribonuclease H-like domain-containing protein [Tanacetum cinerariifolium]
VDNTKTKRPQPRINTKNDRIPSVSKSSRNKNKEAEVEEHHRNLLLSKNNKHMSSACNNFKLDSLDELEKVLLDLSLENLDFSLGGHQLADCLTKMANLLLPVTPRVKLTALMVIMLVPLTLFQAHDRIFKDSHQFRLEVHGNCPLRE